MSRHQAEAIREAFEALVEAWNGPLERRREVADRYTDPDVEWWDDPNWPDSSVRHGREEVMAILDDTVENLGLAEMLVEDVIDVGHAALVLMTVRGRSATAQVPNEFSWAFLARARDGRIIFVRAYLDRSEAFRAAGLDTPD